MNELQIFNSPEFGQVRVIQKDGQPWFVAKDVCEVLDIQNTTDALGRLDDDERARFNLGRQGEANVVNEYGLYSLVLGSRKPEAKQFKRWITHEVIPSIRKNGGYIANQETLTPEQIVANALVVAQNIIQQKDKQLEEQKPKVLFADAVSASNNSVLVGELAKLLKQNGINVGQNRLFEWLRKNSYLGKAGDNYNLPTQMAMNLGLFTIKKSTINNADGSIRVTRTVKVTGKGQIYFINKLKDKEVS